MPMLPAQRRAMFWRLAQARPSWPSFLRAGTGLKTAVHAFARAHGLPDLPHYESQPATIGIDARGKQHILAAPFESMPQRLQTLKYLQRIVPHVQDALDEIAQLTPENLWHEVTLLRQKLETAGIPDPHYIRRYLPGQGGEPGRIVTVRVGATKAAEAAKRIASRDEVRRNLRHAERTYELAKQYPWVARWAQAAKPLATYEVAQEIADPGWIRTPLRLLKNELANAAIRLTQNADPNGPGPIKPTESGLTRLSNVKALSVEEPVEQLSHLVTESVAKELVPVANAVGKIPAKAARYVLLGKKGGGGVFPGVLPPLEHAVNQIEFDTKLRKAVKAIVRRRHIPRTTPLQAARHVARARFIVPVSPPTTRPWVIRRKHWELG